MKYYLTLLLVTIFSYAPAYLYAQTETDTINISIEQDDEVLLLPVRSHDRYLSNGFDAGILSGAVLEKTGVDPSFSRLRFSFIANVGLHYNYDFEPRFGVFVGLGIKNIGFSERMGDSVIKRRVYTIGMPAGFKFGNIMGRNYGFVGGGFDVPFNFKEKGIKDRRKTKSSEFFSSKTAGVMPYIFAGACFKPGVILKLQYYPSNFFNVDYEEMDPSGNRIKPFRGYDARLLLLSLGVDIHYRNSEKPMNTKM